MDMLLKQWDEEKFRLCRDTFGELAKEWTKIMLLFIKMHLVEEGRDEQLILVNKLIGACFQKEKSLWEEIIRVLKTCGFHSALV